MVCSFLEGDTADWATSIVKEIETLISPFANYLVFVTTFRTRFEMVNKASDALTALEQL